MLDNVSDSTFNVIMFLFVFLGVSFIILMYTIGTDSWYRTRLKTEIRRWFDGFLGLIVLIKDYFICKGINDED